MATKSIRSSGTQHNARGVTQGNTLVDPISGLPIAVIEDTNGKKRLAVDANITLDSVNINADISYQDGDSAAIGDPNTGTTLKVNTDGSINTNVKIDAQDGDNISISDGTNTLHINPDGTLPVTVVQTLDPKNIYSEITGIASGIASDILNLNISTNSIVSLISVSGTNIAEYSIELNSSVIKKSRTYFGGNLDLNLQFGDGLKLVSGDNLKVKVIHNRSSLGNFNSTVSYKEI